MHWACHHLEQCNLRPSDGCVWVLWVLWVLFAPRNREADALSGCRGEDVSTTPAGGGHRPRVFSINGPRLMVFLRRGVAG